MMDNTCKLSHNYVMFSSLLPLTTEIARYSAESKFKKFFKKIFRAFFNRRKSDRIKLAIPLYFKVIFSSGKETDEIRATSADISPEGISFLIKSLRIAGEHLWFNDSLSTRNILELKFSMPDSPEAIQAKGEICYFTRLEDFDKNFKIGVSFTEITEEQIKIIKNYIAAYKAAHK